MLPFISSDDLSDFLGEDVSADPVTPMALDSACTAVRTYLQRRINLTTETAVLDGNGRDAINLPHYPVLEVEAVIEEDAELVPDEDYYVKAESGILVRRDLGVWYPGRGNISVTYTHGWDVTTGSGGDETDSVPADIRMVALRAAARIYGARGGEDAEAETAVASVTIGKFSETYAEGAGADSSDDGAVLTDGEMRALARYRKP